MQHLITQKPLLFILLAVHPWWGVIWLVPTNGLWLKRRWDPSELKQIQSFSGYLRPFVKIATQCSPPFIMSLCNVTLQLLHQDVETISLHGSWIWVWACDLLWCKSEAYKVLEHWGFISCFSLGPWDYYVRKVEKACWKVRGYMERSFHQPSHPAEAPNRWGRPSEITQS